MDAHSRGKRIAATVTVVAAVGSFGTAGIGAAVAYAQTPTAKAATTPATSTPATSTPAPSATSGDTSGSDQGATTTPVLPGNGDTGGTVHGRSSGS
ncbi:hypothetical protein [Specibacter cremeus]|uniref:hypothetical protein n=1 Tax=Specibacter cremeus TaxID=1629051 RepID=UPI000F78686F|nr:hypothetical protein [Specibacter cremeus]